MPYENVIIVGAGASAGHSSSSLCPPLGKNLAQTLRREISEFKTIEESTQVCNEDFEAWMGNPIISANPNHYTDILIYISKFFSKFNSISDDSEYLKLIDELGSDCLKNSAFVSLNYEVLLELALRKRRYVLDFGFVAARDIFNSVESENKLLVLKPNGSCNYRPQLKFSSFDNKQIVTIGSIVIVPPPKRLAVFDSSSQVDTGHTDICDPVSLKERDFIIPSIVAAYTPTKQANLNSPTIKTIRCEMYKIMGKPFPKKIVLIGVRYKPNDSFFNLIGDAIVGGSKLAIVAPASTYAKYIAVYEGFKTQIEHVSDQFEGSSKKIKKWITPLSQLK